MPRQAGTAHENDCTAARRPLLTFIQDYVGGWRTRNYIEPDKRLLSSVPQAR